MSKLSLAEYAKAHKRAPGPKCSVCILPPKILAEVTKARIEDHYSISVIVEWLITSGYDSMNRKKIEHHFIESHHLRKPK